MIRTVFGRACGGEPRARRPDGRRASTLTASGTPFEVSVTGGQAAFAPAIRYVTETASQETMLDTRVMAQTDAIDDLTAQLPDGGRGHRGLLRSFIETLYPRSPVRVRSAAWTGIAHHASAPDHPARLKVYGRADTRGRLDRLAGAFPEFAGLFSVPGDEAYLKPSFAAIEVDDRGGITHKMYLKTPRDLAAPMKLIRHFGDTAWQVISELVDCGFDPALLYGHTFFVCCARGVEGPVTTLHLIAGRRDITAQVRELASRHHGTTRAVDTLADCAHVSGADWRFSAVGLSAAAAGGITKLNVYGVPVWPSTGA
ncbi:hypothetical protein [Nocardia sp. NPDC024068]|uniref:hypothetical protein n=1 Tax=Nocardia sp. NPDC024068 TaxID=3157197 RepID=UPI00340E0A6E